MLRIIRTRYKGPTDSRGSRIIATDIRTGAKLIHPYDHAASDAHFAAADALQAKLNGDNKNPAAQWYGHITDPVSKDCFHAYEDDQP